MDIKEFQKKLVQIVQEGKSEGNCISAEQVEECFREDGLSEKQLDKVYEYLAVQKIQVTGREEKESAKAEEVSVGEAYQAAPLSGEEKAYLKNYKETLSQLPKAKEPIEILLQKCLEGNPDARQSVIEFYMPLVADIAAKLHHPQIPLADTIAEGNVHLMMALNRLKSPENAAVQIEKGVRDGILYMIEEQIEQKRQDNTMVDKVAKLEKAVKDLTDGDDDLEFSVDELSVFLDMPKEEIEDVLRLVGENEN